MRSLSFQFDTDYVSEVQTMLSLKGTMPADRSAFERIKAELTGKARPAFGRRPSTPAPGPCNYFASACRAA